MQLAVMAAAERDCELVTHFETDRSWLRKTQMMRIGRLPSADQTRCAATNFRCALSRNRLGSAIMSRLLSIGRRDRSGRPAQAVDAGDHAIVDRLDYFAVADQWTVLPPAIVA